MQKTDPDFRIETYDGLTLYGRRWQPEGAVHAVICLVHGLGEHSGRYAHVAEVFNRAGYAMMACDLRGHGKSEGKRGHSASYTALMDDIHQLLETAKKQYPDLPLYLYGHSLGGNLVIHYALKRLAKLSGIIASAPLIRTTVPTPAHQFYLLKIMYRIWPSLTIPSGLESSSLTRDEQIGKAYENDPLVHDRVSTRLGLDMLRAGVWNLRHAADLSCPMLVMHGKEDRITSPKAAFDFSKQAGGLCTFKLWPNCCHEPHNEPDRQDVLAYVLEWMQEHNTITGAESG